MAEFTGGFRRSRPLPRKSARLLGGSVAR
jgi:hypothetical protein